MGFKDILVCIDRSPAAAARLDAALQLAATFDAHLTALALVAEPFIPAVVGAYVPDAILDQQRRDAERDAEALLERAVETATRAGRSLEPRRETGTLDRLPALLARQSRHVDITLVGQPDPGQPQSLDDLLLEAAFMYSGRPALVVPYVGARAIPPQRVLVAWDGSAEATRAVHDALPLLMRAVSVTVLIVGAEDLSNNVGEAPGADLGAHLARHRIQVDVSTVPRGSLRIGQVILAQAGELATDLIVMGAYGHSRLRQSLFGGVTREVLARMPVPVLLSR